MTTCDDDGVLSKKHYHTSCENGPHLSEDDC